MFTLLFDCIVIQLHNYGCNLHAIKFYLTTNSSSRFQLLTFLNACSGVAGLKK